MPAGLKVFRQWIVAKLRGLATIEGAFAALALIATIWLFYWPARAVQGPIAGSHTWRQSWTYSVAHNFIDESASFFYPRHDWRGDGPGITGSEPPLYTYALSILMRVFGDDAVVCRVPTFLLFVASVIVGWRMLRREGYGAEPWLFVLAIGLSPMAVSDFKQIQPDPVCASLAFIAAAVLRHSALDGSWRRFAIGLFAYTLSVLVKPVALAVGPAMFLLANLEARNSGRSRWARSALAFLIPIVLWGAWHLWAEHLTRTYASGHYLISIELRPAAILENLKSVADWKHILIFLLPAYVSNWWLAPAVLAGLVLGFGPRHRVLSLSFLVWMVGMVLTEGAFGSRLRANWYYGLLLLTPVAYFTAVGLGALVRVCRDPKNAAATELVASTFLVLALLIGAWLAPNTDWGNLAPEGTELGFWSHAEVWFDRTGPALLLVIAVFALASGFAPPAAIGRIYTWMRWLLVPALLWSARNAAFDSIQAVRVLSAEAQWVSTRRMINEARAIMNRFSTRNDLVFISHHDPVVLYRVLRRGFASSGPIPGESKDYYFKRGVRFVVHFSDLPPPPSWLAPAPVVARGEYVTLYCIDPNGCKER